MVEETSESAKSLKSTPYTAEGAKVLYDDWVGSYDETLKAWGYPAPRRIAETLTAMGYGEKTAVKVLDLGCGTGLSGEAIKAAKIGSNGIVGVDISPKSIELLGKDKPGLYSEAYASSIDEKLTFCKDSDFDVVICVGTMSYIENFPLFYSEVLRVSKPGAVFAFTQNTVQWDENYRGIKVEADKITE